MAVTTPVSVDEYLHMEFEHDAEYVDGVIEERPVGEKDHGRLQKEIVAILREFARNGYFEALTELRVQVSATRFRVPDVAVTGLAEAEEPIARTPPWLRIEVLSPTDTMSRTMVRVREFLTMGVPEVWVFDPVAKTVDVFAGSTGTTHTQGTLTVPGTTVQISIAEVFNALTPRPRAQ